MIDFALVPMSWWFVTVFVFGVIIGSFLNVYIYRFHTGKSLGGHSHCLSCGMQLTWFELFPLLSYLVLRGSCRSCGCRIPSRYFWVELLTGTLFALVLTLTTNPVLLLLYWGAMAVLVVITVYDLYHFIIPDVLTAVLTVISLALLGHALFIGDVSVLAASIEVAAALCGAAFFLFLWVISRGKWLGFGDVKLAFPLGLLVGAPFVFSFIVYAFWIGAVLSVLFLCYQHWQRGKTGLRLTSTELTMKSAVPFAPFLVASALIVLFTNINVLSLFQSF